MHSPSLGSETAPRSSQVNGKSPSSPYAQHPLATAPISSYFGELTFGLGEMRERLHSDAYQNLLQTLNHGKKLNKDTANSIAQAIKDWAVQKGATHFCHWFQPMTGLTAEKHDAFISIQHTEHSELKVLERFSGGQLIQGEPDASSFPSGGMRSTFEARGYTAWDPTSPIFIVEGQMGKTLCIPSVFFGYDGQSLDFKTPLLRSSNSLSKAASKFLKLIGDLDTKKVFATLGVEQEYFLIDASYAAKRPDLILTGKTLLGAPSPKGQQLEDHYFGAVALRVKGFWEEVELELYRLGVPVKTRHNEVAPSQFEMAPIFEDVNIAADHNVLTMETLKTVAKKHGFVCLLNEKPFQGLNGSGKHCNWSIRNDKGENLLEPGKTPHQNLRFLAMVAIVVNAVHSRADVLRASIASPGNDHRLGGNEAPPAIISVFLGALLDKIFDSISKGEAAEASEAAFINHLGVSEVPEVSKDPTDRNRTSPFAFTGNKFEFRAVGASANVSLPVSVLNAAVAESFTDASARMERFLAEGQGRDQAVISLIKELMNDGRDIIFSGNNYSSEWRAEAIRRKLPIYDSTADALDVFKKADSVQFLIDTGVLTKDEIESRYNVQVERYNTTVEIELATMKEMVQQFTVPSLEKQLLRSYDVLSRVVTDRMKKGHSERVEELESVYADLLSASKELIAVLAKVHHADESKKKSLLAKDALPAAAKMRAASDRAEYLIADEFWTLPRYRDMLFSNVFA